MKKLVLILTAIIFSANTHILYADDDWSVSDSKQKTTIRDDIKSIFGISGKNDKNNKADDWSEPGCDSVESDIKQKTTIRDIFGISGKKDCNEWETKSDEDVSSEISENSNQVKKEKKDKLAQQEFNTKNYTTIVAKVGNAIITSYDIQNEIITNLIINKLEINQANINNYKQLAMRNLIRTRIKQTEIDKYNLDNYNKDKLKNYISTIEKNLDTDSKGLKNIFVTQNISYDLLVENYETEQIWNTLIFQIYKDQTDINVIDVENEIDDLKESKNKEELSKIKKILLDKKKSEKLDLFSRSHYSNLENTTTVNFK